MRKMIDSGIEWIGEIPQFWNIKKIGQLFRYRNIKVNDTDYPPLSVTKSGIVPQMDNVAKSDANDNRKQVLKDDFVINSRSDRKQSCGLSNLVGSVSLINTVLYGNEKNNITPKYTGYLLKNYGFAEEFYRWGHGIVADLWTTGWQDMKNILLPVPSFEEQNKIVECIECSEISIDKLIFNQEQQIDRLKKYRQSLITDVVTKGLNLDVQMKDSGIDWIGKIPKLWSVEKIKYATNIIEESYTTGHYPYIALENVESLTGRYILTDSKYDLCGSKIAYEGNVVFGKLRPYLGKVFVIPNKSCVSGEFSIFEPKDVTSEYLKYFLLSYNFIEIVTASTYGTKMPRANLGFISNLFIPVPSFEEQNQIVLYLDSKCSQIDRLIEIKQSKIEKLEQYKKSLIYEYVTGKKEAV